MTNIQQWVILLCTLCVLYCVLESILPEKEPFPVIKLVCVLYILIALISPAQNVRISDFDLEMPTTQIQQNGEIEYQNVMINQAQQSLKMQLESYLNSQGVFPKQLEISLCLSDQEQVVVDEVYVAVAKGTNVADTEKLITDYFSCKIPLIVEEIENEGQQTI